MDNRDLSKSFKTTIIRSKLINCCSRPDCPIPTFEVDTQYPESYALCHDYIREILEWALDEKRYSRFQDFYGAGRFASADDKCRLKVVTECCEVDSLRLPWHLVHARRILDQQSGKLMSITEVWPLVLGPIVYDVRFYFQRFATLLDWVARKNEIRIHEHFNRTLHEAKVRIQEIITLEMIGTITPVLRNQASQSAYTLHKSWNLSRVRQVQDLAKTNPEIQDLYLETLASLDINMVTPMKKTETIDQRMDKVETLIEQHSAALEQNSSMIKQLESQVNAFYNIAILTRTRLFDHLRNTGNLPPKTEFRDFVRRINIPNRSTPNPWPEDFLMKGLEVVCPGLSYSQFQSLCTLVVEQDLCIRRGAQIPTIQSTSEHHEFKDENVKSGTMCVIQQTSTTTTPPPSQKCESTSKSKLHGTTNQNSHNAQRRQRRRQRS